MVGDFIYFSNLLCFFVVTPHIIGAPNEVEISKHFLNYVVKGLAPEPLEQTRYLATIMLISFGMFVICLLLGKLRSKIIRTYCFYLGIFLQILLLSWFLEREIREMLDHKISEMEQ
mgnify:CR=1 FL=1